MAIPQTQRFRVILPPKERRDSDYRLHSQAHEIITPTTTGDSMLLHPSLALLWGMTPSGPPPESARWNTLSSRTSSSANNGRIGDIASYLEELGADMLSILYTDRRSLDHPLIRKHMAANFSSKQDHDDDARSRTQQLAQWKAYLQRLPDLRFEIVDVAVHVHACGRKATMWALKRFAGLEGGLCRESVSHIVWEMKDGVWVAVKVTMMRGVSGCG